MSLKTLYDEIANNYTIANRFGSITHSHDCAIKQLNQSELNHKHKHKILDLGVGDGNFLHRLKQHMPSADYTGFDISEKMLEVASEQCEGLNAIMASGADASQYLPTQSQDLILMHFISAYIPLDSLFKQVQVLSRPNGYASIITSTYESFPKGQEHLANFIAQDTLLSCFVGHYYKKVIKNTTVATGSKELLETIHQHQFEVIDHQHLDIPITFNNVDELVEFGFDGTWFLNGLEFYFIPHGFLKKRFKQVFNKIFTFPYQDTHVIDVVLIKKLSA